MHLSFSPFIENKTQNNMITNNIRRIILIYITYRTYNIVICNDLGLNKWFQIKWPHLF